MHALSIILFALAAAIIALGVIFLSIVLALMIRDFRRK